MGGDIWRRNPSGISTACISSSESMMTSSSRRAAARLDMFFFSPCRSITSKYVVTVRNRTPIFQALSLPRGPSTTLIQEDWHDSFARYLLCGTHTRRTKNKRPGPPLPRKYVTTYPNDTFWGTYPLSRRVFSPAMRRSLFLSIGAVMHLLCGFLFLLQLGTEHVFLWAFSYILNFLASISQLPSS